MILNIFFALFASFLIFAGARDLAVRLAKQVAEQWRVIAVYSLAAVATVSTALVVQKLLVLTDQQLGTVFELVALITAVVCVAVALYPAAEDRACLPFDPNEDGPE